jgi:flagellar motor switch protein FliM
VDSAAVTERRPGISARRRSSGPHNYDFRRPNKLSREHVRALQLANETFAKQISTILTTTLRAVSSAAVGSVEQLTYDEYVSTLPNPTFAVVVSLAPLDGVGIFEIAMPSAMAAVDYLLGGPGGDQPERLPTEIEVTLLKGLLARLIRELGYAYETYARLDPAVVRVEYNAQFAGIAAPSDLMIVTAFDLHIGPQECTATLAIPYTTLTPLLAEITAASAAPAFADTVTAGARAMITGRLTDVAVDVDVRFEPVEVTSGDLLHLAPGDVVRLGHLLTTPLTVTADGTVCAKAVPGSRGRRLAVMIVDDQPQGAA